MPLFLKAEPAITGTSFRRNRRTAQRSAQLRRLQLVLFEIFREDGIVVLGDVLDDLIAMLFVKFRAERRSL